MSYRWWLLSLGPKPVHVIQFDNLSLLHHDHPRRTLTTSTELLSYSLPNIYISHNSDLCDFYCSNLNSQKLGLQVIASNFNAIGRSDESNKFKAQVFCHMSTDQDFSVEHYFRRWRPPKIGSALDGKYSKYGFYLFFYLWLRFYL